MKKIMICAIAAMAAASVWADPSWALVTSGGVKLDDTDGGYADRYTAYLCTKEAAVGYFGGADTIAGINAYMSGSWENYDSGLKALQAAGAGLDYYDFDKGAYSFNLETAVGRGCF